MYFSAETDRGFHTWRQLFPHGMPEQVTFGATEEEGIAMWPDGRSFAASVGYDGQLDLDIGCGPRAPDYIRGLRALSELLDRRAHALLPSANL